MAGIPGSTSTPCTGTPRRPRLRAMPRLPWWNPRTTAGSEGSTLLGDGHQHDLAVLEHEGRGHVVDVAQDEVQVARLAALAQVLDAAAGKPALDRLVLPVPGDVARLLVLGYESALDEARRHPGAAVLVLLAELAARAR